MSKHIKIEKETVWIAFKFIIGYSLLSIPVRFFQPSIERILGEEVGKIELLLIITVVYLSGMLLYLLLFEMPGTLIRNLSKGGNFFKDIKLFDVKIPVDEKTLQKLNKKYKRKKNAMVDMREEYDFEFADRIINKILKEELK